MQHAYCLVIWAENTEKKPTLIFLLPQSGCAFSTKDSSSAPLPKSLSTFWGFVEATATLQSPDNMRICEMNYIFQHDPFCLNAWKCSMQIFFFPIPEIGNLVLLWGSYWVSWNTLMLLSATVKFPPERLFLHIKPLFKEESVKRGRLMTPGDLFLSHIAY